MALTDSPVSVYGRRMDKKVLAMLKEVCLATEDNGKLTLGSFLLQKTINWVVDSSDVDTDLGENDCCVLRSAGER